MDRPRGGRKKFQNSAFKETAVTKEKGRHALRERLWIKRGRDKERFAANRLRKDGEEEGGRFSLWAERKSGEKALQAETVNVVTLTIYEQHHL